jgi:hypothetical protein
LASMVPRVDVFCANGLSDDVLKPLGDFLLASAAMNDPGFPQHLAAVHILLAHMLGVDSAKAGQAAAILAARTKNDSFFAYLNEGAIPSVVAAVLSTRPAPDRPSTNRFQWTWERVATPNSWAESMYWECIFLGNWLRTSHSQTRTWLDTRPAGRFQYLHAQARLLAQPHRGLLLQVRQLRPGVTSGLTKHELKERIMAGIDDVNRHPIVHTWSYKLADAP